MELLSVEYGDFSEVFDGEPLEGERSACLKVRLAIDPALAEDSELSSRIVGDLALVFPAVQNLCFADLDLDAKLGAIAQLTGALILDLQRDLCEWPAGHYCHCRPLDVEHEYEVYVETIDERVGRFSAQLAVEVMRMMMLQESFDPRMIWIIDLVRRLRRQSRWRLSTKRVANLLGCSRSSAEWAIRELERYGFLLASEVRRTRRSTGGRVLVIDDSAQIRDLLTRTLEVLGYDVITAVDGEEGLILLDWASYEAIFVDLIMPGLDGLAFLQRARAEGLTCPIFVISAYDHRWGPDDARALGATAYVRKPVSTTEIESLIKKHLTQRKR